MGGLSTHARARRYGTDTGRCIACVNAVDATAVQGVRYVLERCSAGALDTALLLTACAADWRACSVILWHALDECVIIEVGSNIQSTRVSYSVGLATVVASVRGFELSWSEGVLP